MNKIELNNCIPLVFSEIDITSSLWGCGISFERGNRYLIKASSGRGKSTFCSYLVGQRNDYSGSILFDNQTIPALKSEEWVKIRQSELAYLPQGLMLFDELSPLENIELKSTLTNHKSSEWIIDSLNRLGLGERINSPVGRLSYGEKQRVAAIRALSQPFTFLLLDEPVSHLDDNTAKVMSQLIEQELEYNNAALIATSIGKELPIDYSTIINL